MSETMRREILSQPELLERLLPALRSSASRLDLTARRVLAGGCGDGAYAAGAVSALFTETGTDYRQATAHDLAFHIPVGAGDLVVLISISGTTRRTVQAARRAAREGASTLAITCEAESALAGECSQALVLPFRPLSRRTPHTADYLATLLALSVIAEARRGARDSEVDLLPRVLADTIEVAMPAAEEAARRIALDRKLFVLGQGSNLSTAQYIAAKFHESGGVLALAGETENFVHGMNFMVDPEDCVCVIGGDGPGDRRAEELLPGLSRLCRTVVPIGFGSSAAGCAMLASGYAVRPALTVYPAAVAGQVLCLSVVIRNGLAVEEPRAGRAEGALHGEVQRAWMTMTEADA